MKAHPFHWEKGTAVGESYSCWVWVWTGPRNVLASLVRSKKLVSWGSGVGLNPNSHTGAAGTGRAADVASSMKIWRYQNTGALWFTPLYLGHSQQFPEKQELPGFMVKGGRVSSRFSRKPLVLALVLVLALWWRGTKEAAFRGTENTALRAEPGGTKLTRQDYVSPREETEWEPVCSPRCGVGREDELGNEVDVHRSQPCLEEELQAGTCARDL